MKGKQAIKAFWAAHQGIGKFLTCLCLALAAVGFVGLAFGTTRCATRDETFTTNVFLDEQFSVHDDDYVARVNSAKTISKAEIINSAGEKETISGHFAEIDFEIFQKEGSTQKPHAFDQNDFKLKDHTGVYLPLNDIGAAIGWDLLDVRWDKKDDGLVISSADIQTKEALNDFSFVGQTIAPGKEMRFHVFLPISDSKVTVENSLLVLEVDFFTGGMINKWKAGADVILLPRPESLRGKTW